MRYSYGVFANLVHLYHTFPDVAFEDRVTGVVVVLAVVTHSNE